jgi:hypothetical protein
MSETITREERRSALDDFAAKVDQPGTENLPATMVRSSPPSDWQHGAVAVAVRRETGRVLGELRALAAAAGTDWYYRWPVKNKRTGTTDWVEGPSIKMANDLVRIYGNCEVDTRYIDDGRYFQIYARFLDLESGAAMTRPFQQRKSGSKMGDDTERNNDIALQIGVSKAIRNVVTNILRTYADFALEEAKGALVDKIGSNIDKWRRNTLERLDARGVELPRVEAVIGRPVKNWLAPDIAKVIAMMAAVVDGMATLDETFPPFERQPTDLDKFADTSPSNPARTSGGDVAGASIDPAGPPPVDAASAHQSQAEPSSAAAGGEAGPGAAAPGPVVDMRDDAIDIVFRLAGGFADPEERMAKLDLVELPEGMQFYPDFARALLQTGAKIIKGQLTKEEARKYLTALPLRKVQR